MQCLLTYRLWQPLDFLIPANFQEGGEVVRERISVDIGLGRVSLRKVGRVRGGWNGWNQEGQWACMWHRAMRGWGAGWRAAGPCGRELKEGDGEQQF